MATLVTHYKFENDYTDSSGQGNTLTAQGSGNSFSTTIKKVGSYSLQLNGSGYASIVTPAGITTGNADRSFGGWIYLADFTVLSIPFYMGTQAADKAVTVYNSNSTHIDYDQNTDSVSIVISENSANTWYWWWFEYTAATKTIQLYINNVSKGSAALTSNSNLTFGNPGLTIGAAGDSSAGNNKWTGNLDDWRVYNGVTTSQERADIYALGQSGHYLSTNRGYW